MSIFASQTQETISIPFDPPHTVTVRKLTGKEHEAAQVAHRAGVAAVRPNMWSAYFRRVIESATSTDGDVRAAIADPLLGYDRFVVVKSGLLAWTYPEPMTRTIDDLDDESVDFIATEILRLTKPALFFISEEDAKAAQKETDAAPPSA